MSVLVFKGRGAHLTTVPIQCSDSPKFQRHNRTYSHNDQQQHQSLQLYTNATMHHNRSNSESGCDHTIFSKNLTSMAPMRQHQQQTEEQQNQQPKTVNTVVQNGCLSTRENLLAKTDVAMASLLVRLDQVAAQCNAAQVHGGGRLICEEKFQVSTLVKRTMFYFSV